MFGNDLGRVQSWAGDGVGADPGQARHVHADLSRLWRFASPLRLACAVVCVTFGACDCCCTAP